MRDLTSQTRVKDVLATEPDHAIIVKSGDRPRKTKKQKLAILKMEGAFESTSTFESEGKRWYFRLLLKIFGH